MTACCRLLFFHHLTPDQKAATLREVQRVLRPGGELHIADWGAASGVVARHLFYAVQLLDGFPNTTHHVSGAFPRYLMQAGFKGVAVRETIDTMYGTMSLFYARAPGSGRT